MAIFSHSETDAHKRSTHFWYIKIILFLLVVKSTVWYYIQLPDCDKCIILWLKQMAQSYDWYKCLIRVIDTNVPIAVWNKCLNPWLIQMSQSLTDWYKCLNPWLIQMSQSLTDTNVSITDWYKCLNRWLIQMS